MTTSRVGHLGRRFVGSLSQRPPDAVDSTWAESHLLQSEVALWRRMSDVDRRHAISVTRRFVAEVGDAERAAIAAVLLHDVGKVESELGTIARVVATIVGPRTKRFRRYHDHERIGADLLAASGADPLTVDLVAGRGPPELAAALRRADDV